ncbi:MAG: LptF/LptG family permease [Candidatus Sumerlaeaceae bacterium]|nr:LptF/LptG family permease [Candidatus Sumerlaeaceae bacterium]
MSILQRYVLRELLAPLGIGMVVFTFIFLVGQFFRIADLLLNRGVPWTLAGEMLLTMLPSILSLTIPMALLVAILLGIGRLSADREILAMRMSGINLFHVCIPVLALGAILSCAMIYANQEFVPFLRLKTSDLATQIEFKVLANIPPNRFFPLAGGSGQSSVFFYQFRDPETDDMRALNIKTKFESELSDADRLRVRTLKQQLAQMMRQPEKHTAEEIKAVKAKIERLEQQTVTNQTFITASAGRIQADIGSRLISFELTSGSLHVVDPDNPLRYNTVRFDTMSKGIRPRFERTEDGYWRKRPEEMSVAELRGNMRANYKVSRMAPEYYQRFSIPLACLAFALTAIPLAIYARPTGKAIAFAMSFMLIFLYYGLLNYGVTLTKAGSGVGPWAIFFPNVLLSAVGAVLLYRTVTK